MKRFFKVCLLFSFGLCTLFLFFYIFRPKHSENYLAAINHKLTLLDSIPSPRIIILGGSNACFGIDSETISDTLNIPVINLGLHANVGLKYYLDIAAQKSRDSDVIIIMPELQQFYGHFNGQPSVLSPLFFLTDIRFQRDILRTLNFEQFVNIIKGASKSVYDIYMSKTVKDSIYNVKGFNEFGDHNSHWYADKPSKIEEASHISKVIDEDAVDYVIEKVNGLRHRSNKVLLFPPTITESYYQSEIIKINEIYTCFSIKGCDFSVAQDYYVVPDEYSFDTTYHRDKNGVDIITSRIIKELFPIIKL